MTKFHGQPFIAPEGVEELSSQRVNFTGNATGTAPISLLAQLPSDECGCPEEIWRINGLILTIHFEADRTAEAFLDAGDWQMETAIDARSLDDLRAKAFQWYADVVDFSEEN